MTSLRTLPSAAILEGVRNTLRRCALSAVIIPSSDPHNSEYVAERYMRRAFVTNFEGSAGTALITLDEALLWTDGRYWLEAAASLYPEWHLMRDGDRDVPVLDEWVAKHLGNGASIGVDASVVTIATWRKWESKFRVTPCEDVVTELMRQCSRGAALLSSPAAPPCTGRPCDGFVYPRPAEHCGLSVEEKLASVADAMKKKYPDASFLFVSGLDEVAWLTNLRGSDVPFNPVFYSYALVEVRPEQEPKLWLFVDRCKLGPDALAAMKSSACVHVLPYDAIWEASPQLPQLKDETVLVDENQVSFGIYTVLKDVHRVVCCKTISLSPVTSLKALKNATEREGFRNCHIRDGVALTRYLAWLTCHPSFQQAPCGDPLADSSGTTPDAPLTEWSAAEVLEAFRKEEMYFVQLSFPTISGSGANGAIIHYRPTSAKAAPIRKDALYLVDSGAQYLDGTTDVTRTINIGQPSDEEREAYTLVLKGNIALQTCVFPRGTTGHRIDALARLALWKHGLNYSHGTGHGVGSFLNVHEGPHGIGVRPTATGAPLEEAMIVSNEPGFYKPGAYGIRIENLELVVPAVTKYGSTATNSTGGVGSSSDQKADYLTFETLTMVPLCRDLIDVGLLTGEEIQWIDRYHGRVREALTPRLIELRDTRALEFLLRHTSPLV